MKCRRCGTTKNLIRVERATFNDSTKREYACEPCLEASKRTERNRGTMKYRLPMSDELAEIIERGKLSNSRISQKYKNNVYSH